MIQINVYCAALEKSYDFKADETVELSKVAYDMAEMVSYREHLPLISGESDFVLCDISRQKILDPADTLVSSGICSGDRLMLL